MSAFFICKWQIFESICMRLRLLVRILFCVDIYRCVCTPSIIRDISRMSFITQDLPRTIASKRIDGAIKTFKFIHSNEKSAPRADDLPPTHAALFRILRAVALHPVCKEDLNPASVKVGYVQVGEVGENGPHAILEYTVNAIHDSQKR